jgi:signal transduction histidine kinase
LINLISNALKFTTTGSIIVDCNFDKENLLLDFSVIDTGIGIRKVDQVKLFKMFGKLNST